jgi:hypothetical protein
MSTQWERSADVLWRRTATGVVVLPNNSRTAVTLGGSRAELWESLARPQVLEPTEELRHLAAIGAVRESADG